MRVARGPATALTTAFLTSTRAASQAAFSTVSISSTPASFSSALSTRSRYPWRRQQWSIQTEASTIRHPFLSVQSKFVGSTSRRSNHKISATGDEGEVTSLCDGPPLPMRVHHLSSVGSTQDEARKLLVDMCGPAEKECPLCFAVSASEQISGRGTKGRDWIGRPGNAFVTVCLPSDLISSICPLTLLPLKIGSVVAQETDRILKKNGAFRNVRVKWPNDVLVDDKKIAGVLIESHYDSDQMESWFLIGIGVNVAHAPKIFQFGPQRGRQATCLAEHCVGWPEENENGGAEEGEKRGLEVARGLAADIARSIHAWACASQSPAYGGSKGIDKNVVAEAIVREWSEWSEFGKELVLRDKPGNEAVTPLGVELDGQLRVKTRDGKITLLCADYLL